MRGVNKATGIRDVVEFLHMSQADTIGFGDGQNDFDMLRYCDVGVAMGNSSDEVKAVANIVTDDIKEDGLKMPWCILDLSKNAPWHTLCLNIHKSVPLALVF